MNQLKPTSEIWEIDALTCTKCGENLPAGKQANPLEGCRSSNRANIYNFKSLILAHQVITALELPSTI